MPNDEASRHPETHGELKKICDVRKKMLKFFSKTMREGFFVSVQEAVTAYSDDSVALESEIGKT